MSKDNFKQGLFWRNLPIKNKDKFPKFLDSGNDYILNNTKTPFIIFTGTGSINFSELDWPKAKSKLRKCKDLSIFIFEPLTYYIAGKKPKGYHSTHPEIHYKHQEYIRSIELDCILDFIEDIGIKVTVYTTDYRSSYFLEKFYKKYLTIKCLDSFIRQGHFTKKMELNKKGVIKKTFFCANNRYSPHRHLIMAFLANKKGNYTWHFIINCDLRKKSWLENDLIPWRYIRYGETILNKNYFYISDKLKDRLIVEHVDHFYYPVGLSLEYELVYEKGINDCFCAVIGETRFAQPTANISEKTLYAMGYSTPFIIVGPPFTLEYLKKLGFKTFSHWWDESYDQEENHTQRLLKIFETIDYINRLSIPKQREIYKEMKLVLKHNKDLFKSFSSNKQILP